MCGGLRNEGWTKYGFDFFGIRVGLNMVFPFFGVGALSRIMDGL